MSLRNDVLQTDFFYLWLEETESLLSEAMSRNIERWPEAAVYTITDWYNLLNNRAVFITERLSWMDTQLDDITWTLPINPWIDTDICVGDAINIYSGDEYNYNFIHGPDTSFYTPTSPGEFIAEVSDGSGCYDRVYIAAHPIPDGNFVSSYFGFTTTITCMDTSGVSYHYEFGDGTNETSDSPIITHTYSTYGTYLVTITVTHADGGSNVSS